MLVVVFFSTKSIAVFPASFPPPLPLTAILPPTALYMKERPAFSSEHPFPLLFEKLQKNVTQNTKPFDSVPLVWPVHRGRWTRNDSVPTSILWFTSEEESKKSDKRTLTGISLILERLCVSKNIAKKTWKKKEGVIIVASTTTKKFKKKGGLKNQAWA